MKKVMIDKTELLKTVKANREKHHDVFLKALDGYQNTVIKTLEAMLDDAKKGLRYTTMKQLVQPVDQTREYDKVIRALEMSVDSVIELTEDEFSQYVMDDWNWKHQFLLSNSTYTSTAMYDDED